MQMVSQKLQRNARTTGEVSAYTDKEKEGECLDASVILG